MKIRDLVNAHVRDLAPYVPGKPVDELERELGLEDSIKLASNESPLGPSRRVIEAILAAAEDLNRYPDDSCFRLRAQLAKALGVSGDSTNRSSGWLTTPSFEFSIGTTPNSTWPDSTWLKIASVVAAGRRSAMRPNCWMAACCV